MQGLSINLATIRKQCDMREAVEACLAAGIDGLAHDRTTGHGR